MSNDGRNPEWPKGSIMIGLWEAVFSEHDLSAVDCGRLRLALDDLHDALMLLDESQPVAGERDSGFADRERIATVNATRSARKAVRDLVADLTGDGPRGPGRPPKGGPVHGHRTQAEKRDRNGDDDPEE